MTRGERSFFASAMKFLGLAASGIFAGIFFLPVQSMSGASSSVPEAQAPTSAQAEFFERHIRPVLVEKCYGCHSSAEKIKGGLALDTRESLRKGGDSGRTIVPGDAAGSLLIKALRWEDPDLQMPPLKSGGKLPGSVVARFEEWIAMGAPDPRTGEWAARRESAEVWSAKPLRDVAVPVPGDSLWARSDMDRFILAAMEARGLRPVADSEPRALLRRVFCDLTGMPPNVVTVEWFERECAKGQDSKTRAYEAVVDRLLAMRGFGERWGRHWLDVARYAESSGLERNALFPTAWRYRDYVIESVHADKPYNEFIREQIAGDLLPHESPERESECRVATGFLALGVKNLAEKNPLSFEMDMVDEQIDTVSRAVLGLTVSCARCHNHKSDPITMEDYYGFAGILRSTRTFYGTNGRNGRNASALLPLTGPLPRSEVGESPGFRNAAAKKKVKGAKKQGMAAEVHSPQELMQMTAGVCEGRPVNSPLFIRGEVERPGPVVPRGLVQAFSRDAAREIPGGASGRLQLADWLASPQNPLTARVQVNRVWMHLFGAGIVRTADNFGASGDAPTHPELLDYLSRRFIEGNWSLKKLVREMVLSRTYQLSTSVREDNRRVDPGNSMFWRANPRRLDAEAIRDAMLVASGLLNLKPPGGSMVASIGDGVAGARGNDFLNAQFHYRSIYLPIVRDYLPACLEVFDFAEPSLVVARRDESNVPTQALYLMNSPFVWEQARALAGRATEGSVEERIAFVYRAALCRPPRADEIARARMLLAGDSTRSGGKPSEESLLEGFAVLAQALLASAEFRYLADTMAPNAVEQH